MPMCTQTLLLVNWNEWSIFRDQPSVFVSGSQSPLHVSAILVMFILKNAARGIEYLKMAVNCLNPLSSSRKSKSKLVRSQLKWQVSASASCMLPDANVVLSFEESQLANATLPLQNATCHQARCSLFGTTPEGHEVLHLLPQPSSCTSHLYSTSVHLKWLIRCTPQRCCLCALSSEICRLTFRSMSSSQSWSP